MATSSIGAMFVELGLKDTDFKKGLKEAEKSLKSFGGIAQKVRKVMDKAIIGGFVAATAAVTGFVGASASVGANFEQALQTVGAIAGATREDFGLLEDKARELGATTAFTATEAATAMQDFARAGLSVNQIVSASGPAMLLAGSAGAEMSQATTLLASTLAQFTMGASESTRVSDVMSTALRRSLFDISSLTEAMKYGGTVGSSFGMSLEEVTASLAMFRNLGLEGSMAGTNFRMALSAAAKPTANAKKVLAEYNLTAQDINPELHSFAEIMQTVGDAAMTTSDALQVFGLRSGANVATIAREFASGTTQFHGLLNELENSAGSTQELYDTMADTVLFQSKIVFSSLQELMLTSFDTFKAPLKDLMTELAALIQTVAQVFARESGNIGKNAEGTLGDLIQALRDNRELIAVSFVHFAKRLSNALMILTQWVPILTKLAGLVVLVFAADKVRLFTIAVQSAIVRIGALSASVRTLMATLTAASGGIYALVAAVGTLVAGITAYVVVTNKATEAADRLREAEAQLEQARTERSDAQLEYAEQLAEGLDVRLGQVASELAANGELTDSIESLITSLQGLSAEQIAAGLQSGEYFEATLNGTQVILDHNAALMLQWENTSVADDVTNSLTRAQNELTAAQERSLETTEDINAAIKDYNHMVEKGYEQTFIQTTLLAEYRGTVEGANAALTRQKEITDELQATERGLAEHRELALQSLQRQQVRTEYRERQNEDAMRAAAEALKERQKLEKELEKAMRSRADAVESILQDLEEVGADEEQMALLNYERRLDKLRELFDEEKDLRIALGRDLAELNLEQARAEETLRRLFLAEQAQRRAEEELKAQEELAEKMASLIDEEARRNASTITKIRLDMNDMLAEIDESALEERARVREIFAQREADARAEITQQVLDLVGRESDELLALEDRIENTRNEKRRNRLQEQADVMRKREALELEMHRALIEFEDASAEEKEMIREHYLDQINSVEQAAFKVQKTRAEEVIASIARASIEAGRRVKDAIAEMVTNVSDLLLSITGFSFNLFDAVSDVADQMQEVAELREQLAAGEITLGEFEEGMAELPAKASDAAVDFVDELISGVVIMVQTFVEAAPVFIDELASNISQITDALVEGMPDVIDSLIEVLPKLIDRLATGLVAVVQMLAEQAPVIVKGILDQIPSIIDALVEVIPVFVEGLTSAVVLIIESIPQIIDQILQNLPTIIEAVIGSLTQIVTALAEMMPMLISVIIENLPTLLGSLVTGVLSLVDTIVVEIVGKMIPAIIRGIPKIVTSLLDSVVVIIDALVAQLPTIIENLILAVADVVVAIAEMIPQLIVAVVEALPAIVSALVAAAPALINALIRSLPQLFLAIVSAIPTLIVALVTEAIPATIEAMPLIARALIVGIVEAIPQLVSTLWNEVFLGIAEFVARIWDKIKDAFMSLFGGIFDNVRAAFSDTPSMQRMTASGGLISLAPNDYFIAAQNPSNLLQQALQGVSVSGGEVTMPGLRGMSAALMQVAASLRTANATNQSPTSGSFSVVLKADGQVLDSVLFKASKRGMTPHLESRARKSTVQAGVHPGFSRGRFTG